MDDTNTATGTDEAVVETMATAPIQTTKSGRRKAQHAAAVTEEPAAPTAEPWPPKAPAAEDVTPPAEPAQAPLAEVATEPETSVDEAPVDIEDAPEVGLAEVVDITPPADDTAELVPGDEDAPDELASVPPSADAVASSSFVSSFSQVADAGVADLTAGVKAASGPATKRAASAAGAGVLALLVLRKGLRRRARRRAG